MRRLQSRSSYIFIFVCASCLAAADGPGHDNAAVKYLRADASLRQSHALEEDAYKQIEGWSKAPLDEEMQGFVKDSQEALAEFHHAAAMKNCEWEISNEDGPRANTAHRGAIRELAFTALLRARFRFRGGDPAGATQDLLDATAAARHLTTDGTLASVLMGYGLETRLTEVIAANLRALSPDQLGRLASAIHELPTGSNLKQALAAEKLMRHEFADIIGNAQTRDDLIRRFVDGIPTLKGDASAASDIVDGCGGSRNGVISCIRQQETLVRDSVSRFSDSPERFEQEYKAAYEPLAKSNPIARSFTPSLPRMRWVEAYMQTRRALLRAAIAVLLDGNQSLNAHRDPYDGSVFAFEPAGPGFRLQSRLAQDGKPLTITTVETGHN